MKIALEVIKIEEITQEPKGNTTGSIKILIIVLASVILTAGIVYQATGSKYEALLEEKDATIILAQSETPEPQGTTPTVVDKTVTVTELVCETCHDTDQTKGFHSVSTIVLLSDAAGQNPRVCTTCHGDGPHTVHQKKLSTGAMECGTCHVSPEGDYIVPQVPEGGLLVCESENCHVSGPLEDSGNYVSIHIIEANRECKICHMGDPVKVHKKATEKLGIVG